MTKKYSYMLRIFALILVAVLSGCGKGCGKQGAGAEALSLIPASSNAVIGLNWKKLQSSPLGEKIKKDIPKEYAPLLQEIEAITIGIKTQGMGEKDPDPLIVISGKLDQAKIIASFENEAKKHGDNVTKTDYQGVTIYSGTQKPEVAVAFVSEKGLAGRPDLIKQAIDLSKGKGESIEKNKEVMELISNIDRSKMLWAVATIPPGMVPSDAAEPGNPMAMLSALKAMDLAIDYADNLTIDLGVVASSAEDAKQIETMANSYKTLFGGSMAQKDPTLGKVLNALTIQASDKRVKVSLKLDKTTVDEITQKNKGATLPTEPGLDAATPEPAPSEASPPAETQPAQP